MTSPLFKLTAFAWFVAMSERMLFWFWLWQLKDYHFGRFKAHFSTSQGRKLILSPLNFLALVLFLGWFFVSGLPLAGNLYYWLLLWPFVSACFFVLFCLFVSFKLFSGLIKLPVPTKKMLILMVSALLLEGVIILLFLPLDEAAIPWFLLIFLFSPIIFSFLVLLLQPLAVWQRNKILAEAQVKRENLKNLIVVGITGSYGKTSTKDFLYAILAEKYGRAVLKTAENINSEIGIAKAVLSQLNESHRFFIAEIGAYNKGKIKQVCRILKPQVGILTGINEQHMAIFGNQQKIIEAKYELIESLPDGGLAIFNGQNKHCRELFDKTKVNKKLIEPKEKKFMVENLLLAQEAARFLGVSQEEAAKASSKIVLSLPVKKGPNGSRIIESTYSANPDSVSAHLDYLKENFVSSKKIIVMSCLIELGKSSKRVHYEIGEKIGRICDLAVVTTSDQFKHLKKGALESGLKENQIVCVSKTGEVLTILKNNTAPGDVILLEGRLSEKLIKGLIKEKE